MFGLAYEDIGMVWYECVEQMYDNAHIMKYLTRFR